MPGSQELLVIALVALFVLGPERLPEVARQAARLLTRIRNYGVTASKELRGVADLGDLGDIEREVNELRRELERTRADLRRAMRETVASRQPTDGRSRQGTGLGPVAPASDSPAPDVSEGEAAADAPDGRV